MEIFNAQHIGRQIATARKAKNMTQSALADQLGVSYQAVSNWERSQSLPDIDKYAQLAEVLDLKLDDLIGAEGAHTVTVVNDDAKAVDVATLAKAAPVMKPQQVEASAKRLMPNLDSLKEIAPYLSSETLTSKVRAQVGEPGFGEALVKLAPYFGTDDLESLIQLGGLDTEDSMPLLIRLAPFRSNVANAALAQHVFEQTQSTKAIAKLAPFLSRDVVDQLFTARATADPTAHDLHRLAPFVSPAVLEAQVKQLSQAGETKAARHYIPFLSEESLLGIFGK